MAFVAALFIGLLVLTGILTAPLVPRDDTVRHADCGLAGSATSGANTCVPASERVRKARYAKSVASLP